MIKEKVHLRTKNKANGMKGLFLDYSINGKRQQDTLIGLNIYTTPKKLSERNHNKEVESEAMIRRNKKEQEILSNRNGEIITFRPKTSFIDFCNLIALEKDNKKSTQSVWISMISHLKQFDLNVRLIDLNEEWQERWKKYLLDTVSNNSAHSYNNKVRTAIKEAVSRKYINDIRLVKGIPYKEVRREYLTESEIKILINTNVRLHTKVE
jgi:hypothetical protein